MKADKARKKSEAAAEHLRRLRRMTAAGRGLYQLALQLVDKAASKGEMRASIFASTSQCIAALDEVREELVADGYTVDDPKPNGSGMSLDFEWANAYEGEWGNDY